MKGQDKESGQTSGSNDAPKKNHFCALRSSGEQETTPDAMTDVLKVFSNDVYALFDPGATLSFVTALVAKKFDILPDMLSEPFLVSTPVGASVIGKIVYKKFRLMYPNTVPYVKLVELDIFYFDVILRMDWLYSCFASIVCRTRVAKFKHPNEPVSKWKRGNSILNIKLFHV